MLTHTYVLRDSYKQAFSLPWCTATNLCMTAQKNLFTTGTVRFAFFVIFLFKSIYT